MKNKLAILSLLSLIILALSTGCKKNKTPIITTTPVTDITMTTAISGGSISDDGGSEIISRGICWSTSQEPTTDDNITSDGTGPGDFTSSMTGLSENTTYYVRAYAVNSSGTGYGNLETFTTSAAGMAVLTTVQITELTSSSCISGGNVESDGGRPVTEKGVCWSTTEGATINDNRTSDGSGSGPFTSTITNLADGTVYYIRSYATNEFGTAYGNEYLIITPVTDVEGNVYKTTRIGNQTWMAENLRTTHFNNNAPIPHVSDSIAWMNISTPAYTWYRNNAANKDVHGALYTWYTVATGALCPSGWHVPTNAEFQAMEVSIGVPADSVDLWGWRGEDTGTKLKDSVSWFTGNGTNSTGFSAKASGYRAWSNGEFRGMSEITYFWTATDDAANNKPTVAWYRRLDGTSKYIYKATTGKAGGKSVRCIKNQ